MLNNELLATNLFWYQYLRFKDTLYYHIIKDKCLTVKKTYLTLIILNKCLELKNLDFFFFFQIIK